MDNNLSLLVLLGLAIIAIVIFAGYKAWSDYGKQRKILTKIALQTNATRKGNTVFGQRHGLKFRFRYLVGFDEYTLPGMEIMIAGHVPVTLIIYRAPFKKIALKTGCDKMLSENDAEFGSQWHILASNANRKIATRWLAYEKNRGLVEELMQLGCSMVNIGEKGLTGEWYTIKSSSARTIMNPEQVDNAINVMVKMALSFKNYA